MYREFLTEGLSILIQQTSDKMDTDSERILDIYKNLLTQMAKNARVLSEKQVLEHNWEEDLKAKSSSFDHASYKVRLGSDKEVVLESWNGKIFVALIIAHTEPAIHQKDVFVYMAYKLLVTALNLFVKEQEDGE